MVALSPTVTPRPRIHTQVLKCLTAGLILRCLDDLQRWEQFHTGRPPNKTAFSRRESLREARHALRWLNGWNSPGGILFIECCETLAFNPDVSRERLLALIDVGALKVASGHACQAERTPPQSRLKNPYLPHHPTRHRPMNTITIGGRTFKSDNLRGPAIPLAQMKIEVERFAPDPQTKKKATKRNIAKPASVR